MAWLRPGDKPLYEPMIVCLLTQWVNNASEPTPAVHTNDIDDLCDTVIHNNI